MDSLYLFLLATLALAAATEVKQCSGKSYENLSNVVQLTPCKSLPCRLRKGTEQHISIEFTPEKDITDLRNHVTAEVLGVPVPFFGVDGESVCGKIKTEAGEAARCPLRAGTKYVYTDSFPVLKIYPTLNTEVHWALQEKKRDVICFENQRGHLRWRVYNERGQLVLCYSVLVQTQSSLQKMLRQHARNATDRRRTGLD